MKLTLFLLVIGQMMIPALSEIVMGRTSQKVNLVKIADANSKMVCLPYSIRPANSTAKFVKLVIDYEVSARMMMMWKNHSEASTMLQCAHAAIKDDAKMFYFNKGHCETTADAYDGNGTTCNTSPNARQVYLLQPRLCKDETDEAKEGESFPILVTCGDLQFHGRKICRNGHFVQERKLPNGQYASYHELSSTTGCIFKSGPGDSSAMGQSAHCEMIDAMPCAPPHMNTSKTLFLDDLKDLQMVSGGKPMEIGLFVDELTGDWIWVSHAPQSSEIGTDGWAMGYPRPDANDACAFMGPNGIEEHNCTAKSMGICCMIKRNCKNDEYQLLEGATISMDVLCGGLTFPGRLICKNGHFIKELKMVNGDYSALHDLRSSAGCIFSAGLGDSTKEDQYERCSKNQATPCAPTREIYRENFIHDLEALRKATRHEFLDIGLFKMNDSNNWMWSSDIDQPSMNGTGGWGPGEPSDDPSKSCSKMGFHGLLVWHCDQDVTDICCQRMSSCMYVHGNGTEEELQNGEQVDVTLQCGGVSVDGRKLCKNMKLVDQIKLSDGQYGAYHNLSSFLGCIFSAGTGNSTKEDQTAICSEFDSLPCTPKDEPTRMPFLEDLEALRIATGGLYLEIGLFLDALPDNWLWSNGVIQPANTSMEGWAPSEPEIDPEYVCGTLAEEGLETWYCSDAVTDICCMKETTL